MAWFLRIPNHLPQRLLICRTDRIGDFILTLPAIEAASRELGIKVNVLCHESNAPLLRHNPFVEDVVALSDAAEPRQTAGMILRMGFDALLVMVNDSRIQLLLPLLHEIPMRIGPLSKPKMLRHYNYPVVQKRSKSLQNEAEYNLELLQAFGWSGSKLIHPRIYFDATELEKQSQQLAALCPELDFAKGYAVLHAGMSGSALNWPQGHYKELLRQMLAQGRQVVLTGGNELEYANNEQLVAGLTGKSFNLAGKLSLRALAGLCARAKVFIGPSTGPTHVANAAGCPILSFYPPIQVQSATRWQPYLAQGQVFTPDAQCQTKYKCKDDACKFHPCMELIHPAQVLAALQDIWP